MSSFDTSAQSNPLLRNAYKALFKLSMDLGCTDDPNMQTLLAGLWSGQLSGHLPEEWMAGLKFQIPKYTAPSALPIQPSPLPPQTLMVGKNINTLNLSEKATVSVPALVVSPESILTCIDLFAQPNLQYMDLSHATKLKTLTIHIAPQLRHIKLPAVSCLESIVLTEVGRLTQPCTFSSTHLSSLRRLSVNDSVFTGSLSLKDHVLEDLQIHRSIFPLTDIETITQIQRVMLSRP